MKINESFLSHKRLLRELVTNDTTREKIVTYPTSLELLVTNVWGLAFRFLNWGPNHYLGSHQADQA